jgi:hypothetical protein
VNRYLQVAAEGIVPIDAHSGRDIGSAAASPPLSSRDIS